MIDWTTSGYDALDEAAALARAHLAGLDDGRVGPSADAAALRARLGGALGDDGLPAARVVRELGAAAADGLMRSSGGRFFGWVIGGTLPAAVAADWLTSAWDQNAAAVACSPASAVVEEIVGGWLLDLLGLPGTAAFGLVTGCQAAHTTALAAARHRLLADRQYDVERCGLSGAPAIRLVTSESRHESLTRSVRLLGLGTGCVELVPATGDGRIDVAALRRTLAGSRQPTIVVLQAGDLNTGAFDSFADAIPAAREAGAWVHVDGAFGLWAAASRRFRHLLAGAEQADSWATDGHKWLNLPFDSGFVFVRDPAAHSAALSQPTSYAIPVDGVRNQMDWNPEWSRRARGFPAYAALRQLGRRGVEDLVDRCCDNAAALVDRLGGLPGVEVVARPVINQGLVRFLDPGGDHDRRTDAVVEQIQRDGSVWFGASTWRARRVMRVSVCSWRTTDSDVDAAVAAVVAAMDEAS